MRRAGILKIFNSMNQSPHYRKNHLTVLYVLPAFALSDFFTGTCREKINNKAKYSHTQSIFSNNVLTASSNGQFHTRKATVESQGRGE